MLLLITKLVSSIRLHLQPDAAPTTAAYISKLVQHNLYDNASFYHSDLVIQIGTHGMNYLNWEGDLKVNETKLNNTHGTAAVANLDLPNFDNSMFFIN